MFFNVIQITPGCYVGAERNTYDTLDADLLKSSENTFIFVRIIGFKCRRKKKRYTLTRFKVFEKSLRVIGEFPCTVNTNIDTASAGNTLAAVNADMSLSVFLT